MRLFIKHVNMFACIATLLAVFSVDNYDKAIYVLMASVGYLLTYIYRWEILRGIYKGIRFYVDALKEAKAGAKR